MKSATFDPQSGEPAFAHALASPQSTGDTTYLVQFNGPIEENWKAAVEQAGVRLYGYIPDNTLIARADAGSIERLRALPFVRWVGPYHPAYRMEPALAGAAPIGTATVTVQTLPDSDLGALAAQIANWGGRVDGQSTTSLAGYLRVTLPAAHLGDLAAGDGVLWVEPYFAPELNNEIGGGQIMRANEVRQSLKLFGAGQVVGVADTGMDVGNTTNLHPDIKGRLINAYCLGRTSPCDWGDHDAHGTHVAGSVLGNGTASGSNPATHTYAGSHAGVAPEAKLVFQSIEAADGSLSGIPDDVGQLMRQAYNDGARIHTNSWGGPTGGTSQTREYGGYVANSQQADQAAWDHKDQVILFAAGNSGTDGDGNGVIDPDTIGQPGTAKNVIPVGASENVRATGGYNPGSPACGAWGECWPTDFGASPLGEDTPSDNANGMAAFSSRGPTDDGRIKPDLVAPGTNILSVRSHQADAGTGWGEYDANYIYEGGTSMATPLTAGAFALVREWLTRIKGIANPSAALMKSVLINGAADMSPGQYDAAHQEVPSRRPNNVTGWGRVDLKAALDPPAPRKIWFTDATSGLSTGQTATYQVTVQAGQTTQATGPEHPPVDRLATHPTTSAKVESNGTVPQATLQLVGNPGLETGTFAP
ncbi:MAG TPA: S8 family serine peptidase, partial [Roseiflexaceae bacterium]|nr:S8 family serine peptidase [Roseiflexaceae bacterium]